MFGIGQNQAFTKQECDGQMFLKKKKKKALSKRVCSTSPIWCFNTKGQALISVSLVAHLSVLLGQEKRTLLAAR